MFGSDLTNCCCTSVSWTLCVRNFVSAQSVTFVCMGLSAVCQLWPPLPHLIWGHRHAYQVKLLHTASGPTATVYSFICLMVDTVFLLKTFIFVAPLSSFWIASKAYNKVIILNKSVQWLSRYKLVVNGLEAWLSLLFVHCTLDKLTINSYFALASHQIKIRRIRCMSRMSFKIKYIGEIQSIFKTNSTQE